VKIETETNPMDTARAYCLAGHASMLREYEDTGIYIIVAHSTVISDPAPHTPYTKAVVDAAGKAALDLSLNICGMPWQKDDVPYRAAESLLRNRWQDVERIAAAILSDGSGVVSAGESTPEGLARATALFEELDAKAKKLDEKIKAFPLHKHHDLSRPITGDDSLRAAELDMLNASKAGKPRKGVGASPTVIALRTAARHHNDAMRRARGNLAMTEQELDNHNAQNNAHQERMRQEWMSERARRMRGRNEAAE
jgi:hypothetical protein